MFKPNCEVKYSKIKGNSLQSSKNFLEAYKAIDNKLNILDLSLFRNIAQWIKERANEKGYFPDLLISDEQNGKKAVFNIPAFKKLDGINTQIEKKNQKYGEQTKLFIPFGEERFSKEIEKLYETKETLQSTGKSNISKSDITSSEETITKSGQQKINKASFIYDGLNISNEVRKLNKDITSIWEKRDGLGDNLGLELSKAIAGRIFRGGGFIGQIQQALRKKGLDYSIQIDQNNNDTSDILYTQGNIIHINPVGIAITPQYFPSKEKYLLWVETALNEEFYHIVEHHLLTEEDINNIYSELSQEDIKKSESYYRLNKLTPQDERFPKEIAVKEYLRQLWQKEVLGITSEEVQPTGLFQSVKNFLAKVFDFIFEEYNKKSEDSFTKSNYNRIKSFIEENDIPVNENTKNSLLIKTSFPSEQQRQEIEKYVEPSKSTAVEENLQKPEILSKMREILDVLGIKTEFANLPKGDEAIADLGNKLIQFSKNLLSEDNFTEETLHFVVDIIEQKDKELFNTLLDKIRNYKIYSTTLQNYRDDKNYQLLNGSPDFYKIKKEAITKLLVEKLLRPTTSEKDGFFLQLWDKIKTFIQKLFNSLPSNLSDEFLALSQEILNTQFKPEDANLIGKGQYKSKGILNEFRTNKEMRDFFEEEKKTITEIEEVDPETGETEKFYVKNNNKLKKVTSILKESTKRFYQNISQSDLVILLREAKKQKGTDVHKTFEDIINRYIDPLTGRRRDVKLQVPEAKDLLIEKKWYDKVDKHIEQRLNSYPEGTLFSTELTIVHGESEYAGTLDFVAFLPNMQVDILDWKTMDIYYFLDQKLHERDDVSPFNQQYWRNQMTMYKNLLSSNGVANKNFRYTRMIPVALRLQKDNQKAGFVAKGAGDETTPPKYNITELKIGDTNPSNIKNEEFYLTPVSARDETTGDQELDKFIEKLWGSYDRLLATKYPKEEQWKKKAETDKLLSTIRELQVKKKSALLSTMFNDAFKRFDSVLATNLSWLDTIEPNQRFLDEAQDKAIDVFIKEAYSAIEFLDVFANMGGLISKLYPLETRTDIDKAIIRKIADFELAATKKKEDVVNKLTESMDKLGKVYNIEQLSTSDNPGMMKMIKHFSQRDERTLQMAYRLFNIIEYKQKEEEKKLFNTEDGSFKLAQDGFFKWMKDNSKSAKEAFSHLFKTTEIEYVDEEGNVKKKKVRNLVGRIKQQYYDELKSKSDTIREKADKKYEEIVQKYTNQGLKEEVLNNKVKAEYKNYILPWLKENHNLEEFDKLYKEAFLKYQESLKQVVADENPFRDKSKKAKWTAKWIEEHDIYSSPRALDGRNGYLTKEGVLKEELWYTDEYKFLKQTKNKALLDAYDLFHSLNLRARKNGMLSDVFASSLFFPLVKDESFIPNFKRNLLKLWYFKKTVKDLMAIKGDKLEIDPLTKRVLRERPVHFKHSNDPYLSEDLFQIYEKFAKHIVNYESIMGYEDRFNILKFLESNKEYHIEYKESTVQKWKKRIKTTFGKDVENEASTKELAKTKETEDSLNNYINHYLYAQPTEEKPAWERLVRSLMNYTTSLFLNWGLLISAKAYIGSYYSQKWLAGNDYSKRDVFWANLMATSIFGSPIAKIFGIEARRKSEFLIKYFNTIIDNEHEFEDMYKTSLSKRLFDTQINLSNIGMKPLKWVDENIQRAGSILFFMNHTIVDGKIESIAKLVKAKYAKELLENQKGIYKKVDKEIEEMKKTSSLISLTKENSDGKFSLNGVSDQQKLRLQNKIQRHSIETLGVNNKWDKPEISLIWYWQMLLQFKNFMFGLYGSRFSDFRFDDQKDEYGWGKHSNFLNYLFYSEQGVIGRVGMSIWRTLLDLLPYSDHRGVINFNEAAKAVYLEKKAEFKRNDKPFNITEQEFSDMYINNLSNELAQFSTIITMAILALLIKSASGDDKDWYWKMLKRLLFGVDNEISGDVSPTTIKYILATQGALPILGAITELFKALYESGEQGVGFTLSLFGNETGEEMMEKAHPLHRILRATPGARQLHGYVLILSPEYADFIGVNPPPDLQK